VELGRPAAHAGVREIGTGRVGQMEGTSPGKQVGDPFSLFFLYFLFYFEPFQIQIIILSSNLNFKLIRKHTQNPDPNFMFKCNHPKYQ
jgi:hypothetical protein